MKDGTVQNQVSEFYSDIINGLSSEQKFLPSKYFYDEKGSDLFEKICELDEYYPTSSEVSIMEHEIDQITEMMGKHVQLIELGSGSSTKTRLLLDNCRDIEMYVPVDISESFLKNVATKLQADYPGIDIQPVAADYTLPFEIPESDRVKKRVVYFPGSTIGNFTRKRASDFLDTVGAFLQRGDGLLIGVDLKKEVGVLEAAYNDSKGITADFNKNILSRINRELAADFDTRQFRHRAFYNAAEGRIEMHLESLKHQTVQINGTQISFSAGETIHTENSHKYTVEEFEIIAGSHFRRRQTWTDDQEYFSVHYFERV